MFARKLAASLILVSCAAYGQELLDDVAIGRLVRAGIAEQTIVAMVNKQPGKYALSSDDVITLKKAGVSDKILAAMILRNAIPGESPSTPASAPPANVSTVSTAPVALVLHDATPVHLKLTRDVTFTNVKVGETVDFEVTEEVRIEGLQVIAPGRVTASVTEVEPKTRWGKGGKLGLTLDALPLMNGGKVAIRPARERSGAAPAGSATGSLAMVKPLTPTLLFSYDRTESFPTGTAITVYTEGELALDPARFLLEIAFTSNPPGALVSMYGTKIGRTPFTTRLAPGNYQAVFSREGFYDLKQNLTIGPGYANTVVGAFETK